MMIEFFVENMVWSGLLILLGLMGIVIMESIKLSERGLMFLSRLPRKTVRNIYRFFGSIAMLGSVCYITALIIDVC